MRIKDLATRATKLLTGNSWFAVDNGTKVDKIGYSAMVKEAVEEYTGSTLAGASQSVKSALDNLNSKTFLKSIMANWTSSEVLAGSNISSILGSTYGMWLILIQNNYSVPGNASAYMVRNGVEGVTANPVMEGTENTCPRIASDGTIGIKSGSTTASTRIGCFLFG